MKKYRVKVGTRVLGPLSADQIVELYNKSHLQGEEQCQLFPAGEWKLLSDFPEIVSAIAASLDNIKVEEMDQQEIHPEVAVFDYNQDEPAKEESVSESVEIELVKGEESSAESSSANQQFSESVELEKTVVVNPALLSVKKKKEQPNLEKTVVIQREDLQPKEEKVEVAPPPEPEVTADDKTAMFDLSSLRDLKEEVEQSVEELERKQMEEEYLARLEDSEDDLEEEEKEQTIVTTILKKKKTLSPIMALVFIGLLYFLLTDDDGKVVINPQFLNYSFPILNPVIDKRKALQEFQTGIKFYKKNHYLSKVLAVKHFNLSLSNQFRENHAFEYLILTYAELLPNAKDPIKARSVLHKMIKIARADVLKSPRVAMGTALMYYYSGMPKTAYTIIENYLRAGGKPTLKLFAYYLQIMIKANEIKNLRAVAEKLAKVKNKPPEVYMALAQYYMVDDNFTQAAKVIEEGAKKYKTSVPLLLSYANVMRDTGDLKKLHGILKLIEALAAEQSPVYYAKFLEHLGTVSAINKDVAKAAKLFKLALTFYNDDDLRDRLAQLTLGGGTLASNLIAESKIIKLSKEINQLLQEGKLELALLKAVEAADIAPNSVKANLNLARLQRMRGYLKRAIYTLEKLYKKYPQNFEVTYQLSLTYLDAYRVQDNKRLLVSVMNSRFGKTFYYASSLGRYYSKIDNFFLATKWLKKSISLNPLYHPDYFALAKLYFRYKKFKKSRLKLGEAITLAPDEIEYKILFAKLYYETDGVDAAIGYLRGILQRYPDNAKILGEIAIYYYRSGQIKAFERYKKKIDNLFNKDADFYAFLFKMAQIEGEKEKAIEYGLQVIRLSSNNIELMMELGSLYVEVNAYNDAINIFKGVVDRVPNYPKVHYYLSSIYLKQNKLKEAEDEANAEIEQNKSSEFGYFAKAKVMYAKQQYTTATRFLEKAISINGNFVDGLKFLALIKMKQNYLDQAKELYLRARSVDQGDAEIYKQLGEIYERTGQRALALESYKIYLEIDVNASDRARIEAKMRSLR